MGKTTVANSDYNRAKTWQIALACLTGAGQMAFYMLMTSATYIGNGNFGILVAVTGIIITASRIFDGVTDPIIAYVMERYNSKHGKVRFFLYVGWFGMALATTMMTNIGSKLGLSGGAGIAYFILCYVIYIIGYTFVCDASAIANNIMTNDPAQRPTLSVWNTAYSYLVPMIMSVVSMAVILPKFDNIQGPDYFNTLNPVVLAVSFVAYTLACVGISPYDKQESFEGLKENKEEKVTLKDMAAMLKENKELQRYIVAASSDKLAQTIGSAAVVSTLLYGIMLGSMGMSTILSAVGMLPSIVFAIIGARIAGKKGNKKVMVDWTWACIIVNALYAIFLLFAPLTAIGGLMNGQPSAVGAVLAGLFVIFNFAVSGIKMVVSVATGAMRMDIVDLELDRTGNYLPAAVSATYSFIDKLISAFGATIATAAVALIGYTTTAPQQGDPLTWGVKIITIVLLIGCPIIGWICTLCAMKNSELSYEKMAEVQKNIKEKKEALQK